MWVIVHSPFGKALQAIRDNETRAGFVGIRVRRYRWIAFIISGLFTGLAGALWVPLNGLTTPEILYWPFSGEIVFMTVLGGFRTFFGPIVGAHRVQLSQGLCGRELAILAAGAGLRAGGDGARAAKRHCRDIWPAAAVGEPSCGESEPVCARLLGTSATALSVPKYFPVYSVDRSIG